MAERATPLTVGVVAVGFGVCCGLPLLLSAGVLSIVAGLGVGSWLIVTIGVAAIAFVAPVLANLFSRWWLDEPGEQPPFARGLVHVNGTEAREHTELLTAFNARADTLRRASVREPVSL